MNHPTAPNSIIFPDNTSRVWLAAFAPKSFITRVFALVTVLLAAGSIWGAAFAELPMLPQVSAVPTQTAAAGVGSWEIGEYEVKPLARYDVTARVLSSRSYSENREAEVSPIDFALGWGKMADREMLSQLSVSQDNRWYFVKWRNAPVKASEVISNSANTHLIPANAEVAEQLANVAPGSVVHLTGYLVKVTGEDGWTWTSSTARDDTGDGSCEVLWVESVEVHSDTPITYAQIQ